MIHIRKISFIKLITIVFLQYAFIHLIYFLLTNTLDVFNSQNGLGFVGSIFEFTTLFLLISTLMLITNHLMTSLMVGNMLYLLFIFAGIMKIQALQTPILYYDIFQLDDLIRNIKSIDTYILVAIVFTLFVVVGLLIRGSMKTLAQYSRLPILIMLIVSFTCVYYSTNWIKTTLKGHNIKYKWNSNIIAKTQKHGFIAIFIQSIYFSSRLQKPQGFSKEQTTSNLNIYKKHLNASKHKSGTPHENIIVLMVESFQDTSELPYKTNVEVTPTYKKMKQNAITGHVLSPVFGGKSVNAEFELLTGFSHIFIPKGSIPYKDFINNKLPSLAWQHKQAGYSTNVIQAVEMKGYGYESIYKYLGFDHKFTLSRFDKNVEVDPTKRFGSSSAFAKQIIEITRKQNRSFIFAFPNSSHSPWKLSDYPNNQIRLLQQNPNENNDEVLAYLNALQHIDLLFEQLYEWATHTEEKTTILILGDHQPSLKANIAPFSTNSVLDDKIKYQTVPFMIWSNFKDKPIKQVTKFTSMNLLGSVLLEYTDIDTTGFYRFLDEVMDQYQSFSFATIRDDQFNDVSEIKDELLFKKYESFQYLYLSDEKY